MKNFIRAYTFTLVPTTALIIAIFIAYYTTIFSINRAINLGILYGFISGLAINLIPAISMMSKINNMVIKDKKKEQEKELIEKVKEQNTSSTSNHLLSSKNSEQSLYLLLNREQTFDLFTNIIIENSLGTILNSDPRHGILSVRTEHQTINFDIKPLTRHTARADIKAQKYNLNLQKILQVVKEKERSYLNY
jgi:hypothetical protein